MLAAINESIYTWRPAEAIARQAGLSVERVREILESTDGVLRHPDRSDYGYILYTTHSHLVNTSGVMEHYLGTQRTS